MNRFFRHGIAIVAAGAMGFVAACSSNNSSSNAGNSASSSAAASAGGKIDACKLVSADQAGKILGTKITIRAIDTSAAGPDAASMCNYAGQAIGSGFMLIAAHIGYSDAAVEVASQKKEAVADVQPTLPKPSFSDIQGLGDAAYLYKTPGSFQLHVLAHGDAIVINRNVNASAKAVDQAKQIAKTALSNLE
jgi:hypothetical protein